MTAIFEMPLASELLDSNELTALTGCSRRGEQLAWLTNNGWTHHITRGGDPVVGRLYARFRLAGISPAALTGSAHGWIPDFASLKK